MSGDIWQRPEFRVGATVTDIQAGATPINTILRHVGNGYFVIHSLPVVKPKVGDVVDTEEQARLLPVGTVMLEIGDDVAHEGERPAVKVSDNWWMYRLVDTTLYADDEIAVDQPHRVLHIPDADAGTGRTAA